jgi:hypothetical protein
MRLMAAPRSIAQPDEQRRNSHMNRFALTLFSAMLALGSPLLAQAQTGTTTAPGGAMRGLVIADHVRVRAQVQAIDYADRTVVLKGQDGKTVTLKVGPQAKNFDKVKVGDQVRADFYTSTAIALRKAGGAPTAHETEAVEVAAPGEQPHGIMVRTREISARIDAVDVQKREVTLTGPRGNTATLKVGDAVQNLDQIQKGDQVVVRYTEAIALAVDKP